MKEFLIEVTKTARHWIKAAEEDEAIEIAEDIEEEDNVEIEDIRIIDEREIEDEYDYLKYSDDEDEELEEEW